MDLRFPPALALPAHAHERPTLAIVVSGGFQTKLAGDIETCSRSSLRIEPAGSPHTNSFGPNGAHIVVVQPDPRSPLREPVGDVLEHAEHRRDLRADLLGHAIARELRLRDAVSPLALQGLGLELIAIVARSVSLPHRAPPWLAQATDLIHDCFLDGLRVDSVAAQVGVRPSELVRAFRGFHGVPIGSYVRRLRLEWVARRLTESADPIASLAHDAGFADQPHLTRAFHAFSGMTPARYRRFTRGTRSVGPGSDLH